MLNGTFSVILDLYCAFNSPFPNDKILKFSNLKACANHKILEFSNLKACAIDKILEFSNLKACANDKILEFSNLKACANDKINVTQVMKFVTYRIENIVGKGEYAGYQHFLLFPQCFQKPSNPGA